MLKYYSSTLEKGSKGDEVKKWQSFLNSQGYNLSVDGDFGDNTYNATTDWQSKNGLGVDGIVGKNTWGKAGYTSIDTPTPAPNIGSAPSSPTFNTTPTQKPVTDTTKWDDTEKGQAALGDYNAAKDKADGYGDFTYEDYAESDAVKDAGDALKDHIAGKPGDYQSKWQAQLDELMGKIMNREKFSYNFNEDPLYAQYKDNYIRQGKMAMADTMGQAAAMTGGYGSSWAQSVGQQAYQQSLEDLNDVIPELYAMALDRYTREGQDLLTQYGMVADREDLDYSRYRDLVADYLTERDYLQGRYDSEKGFDYGKYVDDRNMDYTLHADGYQKLLDALGIARDDYYSGADMHYTEQANKNSDAWNHYEADESARRDENELLQQDYQNRFNEWEVNSDEAWREAEWDENQRRYEESKTAQENSSGIKINSDGTVDLSSIPGINTSDATWFDKNGQFKSAEYLGPSTDGKSSFRIDGKTVTYPIGTNPYTQTENPDIHNFNEKGAFKNGYQPNNVGGKKLSKTGIMDYMNGVEQNIWETEDGTLYIWDGLQNKYLIYHE